MKKFISIILVFAMLFVTGCSGNSGSSGDSGSSDSNGTESSDGKSLNISAMTRQRQTAIQTAKKLWRH